MAAKIINLREFKKKKAKANKEAKAEQNRAKFGRTKGQKKKDHATTEKAKKGLDEKELDKPTNSPSSDDD